MLMTCEFHNESQKTVDNKIKLETLEGLNRITKLPLDGINDKYAV